LIALALTTPFSAPLTALLFYIWSIFDIKWACDANQHILTALAADAGGSGGASSGSKNPENDWGFGQLLPWFLLLLPIMQLADIFAEELSPSPYHSASNSASTPAGLTGLNIGAANTISVTPSSGTQTTTCQRRD
jgi:hypothetical protein